MGGFVVLLCTYHEQNRYTNTYIWYSYTRLIQPNKSTSLPPTRKVYNKWCDILSQKQNINNTHIQLMRYTHSHTHMHKCLWIYSNMKLRYKSCLVRSLCSNTKYHSIQCLLSVWVQFTIEYLSVSDSTYLFCSVDANVYVGLLEMICCCCYFCWGFDVDILFEIQHPFIRSFVHSVGLSLCFCHLSHSIYSIYIHFCR